MKDGNEDKPGLLEELTNKWKTASGGKKVLWLALALLATYFVYRFKQNWEKYKPKK